MPEVILSDGKCTCGGRKASLQYEFDVDAADGLVNLTAYLQQNFFAGTFRVGEVRVWPLHRRRLWCRANDRACGGNLGDWGFRSLRLWHGLRDSFWNTFRFRNLFFLFLLLLFFFFLWLRRANGGEGGCRLSLIHI